MFGKRFGLWWGGSLVMGVGLMLLPIAQPRAVSAQGQASEAVLNQSLPQRFTAFAANLSNVQAGPVAQTVEIVINHWSTDATRDRLLTVLKEKGEQALLSELQKMPKVGYIRTPNSLAYDLRFARQAPYGDGGRRIFIATDRYVNFWELANNTPSRDYPFTLIEMHLNNQNQGEGKLSIATKVTADGNQIVLEDYANQPVMLKDVKEEKK
jgi:hypothetical protein